jgi:hypothetical protein
LEQFWFLSDYCPFSFILFTVFSFFQQVIAWRGIDERGESGNEERFERKKIR